MLFNVAESTEQDVSERQEYDIVSVTEVLNELDVESSIANPVRLGPKKGNSSWPRPLRVTVKDEETKWKILKQAKNLTHSREEKLETIFLKKDMTPMERQQDAELRKNLKEKRNRRRGTAAPEDGSYPKGG